MATENKELIRLAFMILTSKKLKELVIAEKLAKIKGNDDVFYLVSTKNNKLILHTHEGYLDGYEFISLEKFNFENLDDAHKSLTKLVNILHEFIHGKRYDKAFWEEDHSDEYLNEFIKMEF